MRASSLSDDKIIGLLNHDYVPVLARNIDYRPGENGKEPRVAPAEKAEYERIYREALQAGLPAGTVHVYLLKPDGHVIASMHVADANKPEHLLSLLERVVRTLNVRPGKPLVAPAPRPVAPAHAPDALVLHLTARYVERHGSLEERLQPVLGTDHSSQWGSLPSEDWIVFSQTEWRKLLPVANVRVGDSWNWDKGVSAKLLTHFYPPTENTDLSTNRLDRQSVRATVVSIYDGVIRARLDGELRMEHPFYHRPTHEVVGAKFVGFVQFEVSKPRIRSLRLVTDGANYGDPGGRQLAFGVAVKTP